LANSRSGTEGLKIFPEDFQGFYPPRKSLFHQTDTVRHIRLPAKAMNRPEKRRKKNYCLFSLYEWPLQADT